MNKKKDYTNTFLYITLGSIFLIFIYFGSTSYTSFINIIEIQYILDSKTSLEIGIKDSEDIHKISSFDAKVKIYNLFNRLKIRKDIFLTRPESEKSVYNIKIKYNQSDGIEAEHVIHIFENGILEINNEIFDSSENIYNIIDYMFLQNKNNN